jgi:hypothetical protein
MGAEPMTSARGAAKKSVTATETSLTGGEYRRVNGLPTAR